MKTILLSFISVTSIILTFIPILTFGQNMDSQTQQYRDDFEFFWQSIKDDYCYFDKKQTDWDKVKEIYTAQIDSLKTKGEFITFLENVFNELYDHHASLNANTKNSFRLVPSGTDIWAEFIVGNVRDMPVVTQVRKNFGADKTGIKSGMEIVAVNDVPVQEALKKILPKSFDANGFETNDIEAKNYALRLLLAGNHITPRKLTLRSNEEIIDFFPDDPGMLLENISYKTKVESDIIDDNIGYIRINNCLFDNELIPVFDSVMNSMKETKALILDLRETPSGGNTTVARAILGWFTDKDEFFQKHELTAEERQTGIKRSWMEIVSPREGKYYDKPLVVLADHWTGSVGEGIVIGFDALAKLNPGFKITIMGTKLAGLNGAIYSYEMPNTKIRFSFPVEKLFHVNGTPRELFIPDNVIDLINLTSSPGEDVILNKALNLLKEN